MIINALDILPLIVGLAVLFCTSYEFEFNLSEKIKANVLMEALYVSLSTIVLVMAASPKIASHLSNVRFDVMIVDF